MWQRLQMVISLGIPPSICQGTFLAILLGEPPKSFLEIPKKINGNSLDFFKAWNCIFNNTFRNYSDILEFPMHFLFSSSTISSGIRKAFFLHSFFFKLFRQTYKKFFWWFSGIYQNFDLIFLFYSPKNSFGNCFIIISSIFFNSLIFSEFWPINFPFNSFPQGPFRKFIYKFVLYFYFETISVCGSSYRNSPGIVVSEGNS